MRVPMRESHLPPRPRGAPLAALLAALAGISCAVGPNYQKPEISTPDLWHQELVRGLEPGQGNLSSWWTLLDDPLLTSLIARAREGNLDVQLALDRLFEARARRGIAEGQWFPSVNAGADYSRSLFSQELFPLPGQEQPTNFFSTGMDASWEVDLFGRIRRSVEAADADYMSRIEDYRDVLVLLYAEVGSAYVEGRALQLRIKYTLGNIETQRATLKLVRARNRAGLVGDLDVRQAELNLARTESFLPSLRQGLEQVIHRLGVLMGDFPSALYSELTPDQPIPGPPSDIPIGLPLDLLRQRPDLRSAERRLAAQTARIGVATADLYPRLTILGQFAFSARDAAKWMTGDALSYGIGPTVQWNVFDGGRIRSNIKARDAVAREALTSYERAVLLALEDAENAFVAYVQEGERRDALERSARAAQQSVDLVKDLYRTGLVDFQNVLDMERSLFLEQDQLAASEGRVTQNLIAIYRALGGGWTP